jgi:hypothetical protein
VETVIAILFSLAGPFLAIGVFVGVDHLVARLRGRDPSFDWFTGTRWSGRTTRAKRRTVTGMEVIAGVCIGLGGLIVVAGLIGLLVGVPVEQ